MARRAVEIWLDDARPGRERLRRFSAPAAIIRADQPEDVSAALASLESARREGRHVAGYFSYELGYVFEPRLKPLLPAARDVPLLWFGVFDTCEVFEGEAVRDALAARIHGRAYAGLLAREWSGESYRAQFDSVHALIEAGDIYQANLSFRAHFAAAGDPVALYTALRERSGAAHCAFIDDGERQILSLSPELFFSISTDGKITARPMKGTAPRGQTPADDVAARAALQASQKDRAENLMIVDLLRNDLGRVAQTGSVLVGELFAIETFPTLHQMVSDVGARLRPGVTVGDIACALFPCGSVTGTPKIRAMEVIRECEESPRGVYCGAIGHFAPDGTAQFNVAIRTLTIAHERGELGIGGAIVHDSSAQAEYDECLLKARYYEAGRKPLELIETMRFSPREGFARLDLHLARMERSAAVFGLRFDRSAAMVALETAARGATASLRMRLSLGEGGAFACTVGVMADAPPSAWRYAISPIQTQSGDVLLRHKTNWRETYETELARVSPGCDEILFTNERRHLTEGGRSNIFIRRNGKLLTPLLSEGLLDGCLRRALIDEGTCEEVLLRPADLATAEEVFLGNSLRGLIVAIPMTAPLLRTAV